VRELLGTRIYAREASGREFEATYDDIVMEPGLVPRHKFSDVRFIGYLNATVEPPTCESWRVPDPLLVADHLIASIHPTHLAAKVTARNGRG